MARVQVLGGSGTRPGMGSETEYSDAPGSYRRDTDYISTRITRDANEGYDLLRDTYDARGTNTSSGVTVPALVDVPSGQVVTNDLHQITLDFGQEWEQHHRPGAPDLFPEARRHEIMEIDGANYRDVNNAVYEAGFSTDAASCAEAYARLFGRLDWLETRLSTKRYLMGDLPRPRGTRRPAVR